MKIIPLSGFVGENFDGPSVRSALIAAKGEAVKFEVSSPGGYVPDGLEIATLIRNYSGPTTCHVIGLAASMASYIACAAQRLTAEASAVIMIHLPHVAAAGTEDDFRSTTRALEKFGDSMAAGYAAKCGRSLAEVREIMRAETWYSASEAQSAGFVDEVVGTTTRAKAAAVALAKASFGKVAALAPRPGEYARIAAMLGPAPSGLDSEERAVLASLDPKELAFMRGTMQFTDREIALYAPGPDGRCLHERRKRR